MQSSISDVESLFSLGEKNESCPYYAVKDIAPVADVLNNNVSCLLVQVICVPYVCLIDQRIRDQLNLSIKNSIIIIDECHNFMEALCQIYSSSLNYRTLSQVINMHTLFEYNLFAIGILSTEHLQRTIQKSSKAEDNFLYRSSHETNQQHNVIH